MRTVQNDLFGMTIFVCVMDAECVMRAEVTFRIERYSQIWSSMASNVLTLWVWEVWKLLYIKIPASNWVYNGRRACDVRMDELSTRFTIVDLKFKG